LAKQVEAGNPLLTDFQAQLLKDSQAPAVEASQKAEEELLKEFRSPFFRAKELLEDLRAALHSSEFLFGFGLDAASAKLHPGQPDWNIAGIDEYGHIPTLWELKVDGKADALPLSQWKLVDDEETGLYRQQPFIKHATPTKTEAALRPGYVSGNLVRFDAGIFEYGVNAPVWRQSAMKERALVIGLDGGGWETVCNSTSNMNKAFRLLKRFVSCKAMLAGGKDEVIFATMDHLMHAFVANTKTMGIFGEGLARRMYQLLVPGATMHPLENSMYLEAAFFGPARMQDMKLWVASFPDIFGTPDGDALVEFCKRHRLPLAWALGGAQLRKDLDKSHILDWLPDEPFVHWPVNGDRLLDPSSWAFVGVKVPGVAAAWASVDATVRKVRKEKTADISSSTLTSWWKTLKSAGGVVQGLRGRDCADQVDLCFGTSGDVRTSGQCLCRADPEAPPSTQMIV